MKIFNVMAVLSIVLSVSDGVYATPQCGGYKQLPCSNDNCNPPLISINGVCSLGTMSGWTIYQANTNPPSSWCGNENCYKWIDEQMGFDMNSANLSKTIALDSTTSSLRDGRYIFVLRKNDGYMIMRRYDRDYPSTIVKGFKWTYGSNRNRGNYHVKLIGEPPIFGNGNTHVRRTERVGSCYAGEESSRLQDTEECVYDYVRHSQLNGVAVGGVVNNAWSEVYCAGELRVFRGKIDRINNNSGHFAPDVACLRNVVTYLRAITPTLVATTLRTGIYDAVSTEEIFQCPQDDVTLLPAPTHRYACGYTTPILGDPNKFVVNEFVDLAETGAERTCSDLRVKVWRPGRCKKKITYGGEQYSEQ